MAKHLFATTHFHTRLMGILASIICSSTRMNVCEYPASASNFPIDRILKFEYTFHIKCGRDFRWLIVLRWHGAGGDTSALLLCLHARFLLQLKTASFRRLPLVMIITLEQCFELGWDDKELDDYREELWQKGLNYNDERFTILPANKYYNNYCTLHAYQFQ